MNNINNAIKNSQVCGIDLGTTNSVITFMDDAGNPKIIPNLDGEMLTPSIVYVGPGLKEILVGTPARNMMMLEPKRVIKECKRQVGTNTVYFQEGGQDITPEWCQGQILLYLRKSAIHYFGDPRAASLNSGFCARLLHRKGTPKREALGRNGWGRTASTDPRTHGRSTHTNLQSI